LKQPFLDTIKSKIISSKDVDRLINPLRKEGKKVVFTNGCFDILHQGHVDYLSRSADLGDVFVLGLNSDESVKRLKGPSRPINSADSRSIILAALMFIDFIIVFVEDTPERLIEVVKPDFLVKGGDWTVDTVVGGKQVSDAGGKVVIMDYLEGFSTTGILDKIVND